jgi:malonyl-CoA/methylmalonyl-CoA synthetase
VHVRDPSTWIETIAAANPERTLLTREDGASWTYAAFHALVGRQAAALTALGIAPGDRIVAQVEKSVEALALYLACLAVGAIYAPLNTAYTAAEIDYFIGDSDPKLFVVDPSKAGLARTLPPVVRLETLDARGEGSFCDLAAAAAAPFARRDFAPAAAAAMLYTSGTTGKPKGAVLSRHALASNATTLAMAWCFNERDVLLHALPIYHAHGLFVATNTVLVAGASMLFQQKFDAAAVLKSLGGATAFMGVPTFYTRLLGDPALDAAATAHMRLFVSGSAPLLAETHRAFAGRTGHAILERYGMTETLMNSSNPYEGARRPGTVGPPLPGVEMRVTEAQTGALMGTDEIGMLEVRGPNLFQGYWRNPQKTAEDIRPDGFFITGDLGKIDADGYVHIIGRGKDLIISGGFNVYPKEVEAEIDALPGVIESAVIGVPHPDFGEAVVAVIAASPAAGVDAALVIAALADRLARFKQPKAVFVVEELPRNAMGKVQKAELRKTHARFFE